MKLETPYFYDRGYIMGANGVIKPPPYVARLSSDELADYMQGQADGLKDREMPPYHQMGLFESTISEERK